MVDRQKALVELVTAWAEYEMRMNGIGSEAKKIAVNNPGLVQKIDSVTNDLMSSPDDQRKLALQLAIAELSRSG
jgi:hypothetical protein